MPSSRSVADTMQSAMPDDPQPDFQPRPQPDPSPEQLRRRLRGLKAELQHERRARAGLEKDLELWRSRAETRRVRYNRLHNRKVVRIALGLAGLLRPVYRALRRQSADAAPTSPPSTSSDRDQAEVATVIRALRTEPGRKTGPLVSIVVLSRNGAHHLQRLFTGLDDCTTYRDFEVIVVDNASDDESDAVYEATWTFPRHVIHNDHNASFSAGCNQGVAAARGDYVLLLNNDIEPIAEGWLGAMVDEIESDAGIGAVGALLVYPERPTGVSHEPHGAPDLTVQHRGIRFGWIDKLPWAFNDGVGNDPTDPALVATRLVPAATAACLLIRTAMLRDLGGLDEGYVYGSEDVELCLNVRAHGYRIVVAGRAALFHHEFGTQSEVVEARKRSYRQANLQRFAERWAPTLSRALHLDALTPGTVPWNGRTTRKIALTLTKDDPGAGYGDWYTAHELGDALEQQGYEIIYAPAYQEEWYSLPDDIDVVIALMDGYDPSRAPAGALTIAWVRNWTERWIGQPWFAAHDVYLPSSEASRRLLEDAGANPPGIFPLATNPERFFPRPSNAAYECDYAFTGNYWGVGRSLLDRLEVAPGEKFALFGKNWDQVPRVARYWRGPLPYDELPELYSSTKIVLDDTAGPTLPYGAVNSRVFDAIACGALVLTNNRIGSLELFDGDLPVYENRHELRALLDKYLHDDELRLATAAELRATILARHTYELRARQLVERTTAILQAPRFAIKIGPPSRAEAESWGDTHFARSFARSLRRVGMTTEIHVLSEWDLLENQTADVAVHLRGLTPYVPKEGQFNILWIISHPDDVTVAECNRYDIVFVASATFAAELRSRVDVPVHVLLQATDPERFHPVEPDPALAFPVVFAGNSRDTTRPIITAALDAGVPLTVFGSGWDDRLPEGCLAGDYFPNEELARLYSSAGVVLNDHWPDMAASGFISNRIFDAVACGARVVSDDVPGLKDLFGDAVEVARSPEDLPEAIARAQSRSTAAATALVATEHTFDRRAREMLDRIEPALHRHLTAMSKLA